MFIQTLISIKSRILVLCVNIAYVFLPDPNCSTFYCFFLYTDLDHIILRWRGEGMSPIPSVSPQFRRVQAVKKQTSDCWLLLRHIGLYCSINIPCSSQKLQSAVALWQLYSDSNSIRKPIYIHTPYYLHIKQDGKQDEYLTK